MTFNKGSSFLQEDFFIRILVLYSPETYSFAKILHSYLNLDSNRWSRKLYAENCFFYSCNFCNWFASYKLSTRKVS